VTFAIPEIQRPLRLVEHTGARFFSIRFTMTILWATSSRGKTQTSSHETGKTFERQNGSSSTASSGVTALMAALLGHTVINKTLQSPSAYGLHSHLLEQRFDVWDQGHPTQSAVD
jgi:hypothetical protein